MRLGITSKFFFAILLVGIIVTVAMGAAMRISFERGFFDYINERTAQQVAELQKVLAAAYRKHGDWEFLRNDMPAWMRLVVDTMPADPGKFGPGGPPPLPPPGPALRPGSPAPTFAISLLDAGHIPVVGIAGPLPDAASFFPIEVDKRAVGWIVTLPPEKMLPSDSDRRFRDQQYRASWVIGGFSVLLAALVAMLLARTFLAPVRRLAGATHRLAAGEYSTRVSVTTRDELGQLAGDFNQLANTLEKNEKLRRNFLADISHELRTPLAVLRGELEALEDGVRSLTADATKSLQSEVATLSKLIDDLYQLSLADIGALDYRMTTVDAASLLRVTLGSFRERLAARNIRIQPDIPDAGLLMHGDADRLTQIFNNLFENSLRYTEAGGALRVHAHRENDGVHIDLQDSGPGVPAELLPRLSERLFRVESSRNRGSGGAGLGLSLCKSIIEAHDGKMQFKLSPMGGLWIEIVFPPT
jgi:two-component system sensor histidine kinase BaeS